MRNRSPRAPLLSMGKDAALLAVSSESKHVPALKPRSHIPRHPSRGNRVPKHPSQGNRVQNSPKRDTAQMREWLSTLGPFAPRTPLSSKRSKALTGGDLGASPLGYADSKTPTLKVPDRIVPCMRNGTTLESDNRSVVARDREHMLGPPDPS